MSQEPRVQFLRNGTVEGEVWINANGEVVVEDSNSDETLTLGADGVTTTGTLTAPTVTADEQTIGGTAHISSGTDLAQEIRDAIDAGYRTVVVHQKGDGTAWDWNTDLTIDALSLGGVSIEFDRNVIINYSGDGIPIHVANTWDVVESTNAQFELRGGLWRASGDPSGWIRVDDAYGTVIDPQEVEFQNSTGDCVGIELRNVDGFSEDAYISGRVKSNIGLRFTPASVTGGTGTASFHDTHVENLWVNPTAIGLHLRGNMLSSTFLQPTIQPTANNAVLIKLETGQAEGLTFLSPKLEDASNTESGCIGFQTTANFNGANPPLVINETIHFIDTPFDKNDGFSDSFAAVRCQENRLEIGEPGGGGNIYYYPRASQFLGPEMNFKTGVGRMTINGGDGVEFQDAGTTLMQAVGGTVSFAAPAESNVMDVRTVSSPTQGMRAYHDPSISGDSNTEGPAFYNGTSWISQVDGTTIS